MVESQPSKLLVAGSIPVSRSIRLDFIPPFGELKSRSWRATDRSNVLSEWLPEQSEGRRESKGISGMKDEFR